MKQMIKIIATLFLTAFSTTTFAMSSSNFDDCGHITMAGLSWGSASILGEIDKHILEKGYGCHVEVMPGGTVPSFTSMAEKGQPDIMGELWPNAAGIDLYNQAIADGAMFEAADKSPIGGVAEGWYILPNILEKHPELTTLEAVLARPDLFPHPEDPSKGGFVTCPPGAGCQISNQNLFVANKMEEKGWLMIQPGSYPAEDATISRAHDKNLAWFGYYSAPTAFIGKYDMRQLDWGVDFAGQENWNCITKPDCPNPKPSSWTTSFVRTVYSADFMTDKRRKHVYGVMDYFSKREIPGDIMNNLLLYMADNQATAEEVAEKFIKDHEDLWSTWVSKGAHKKLD